jgi:AraC-like DNA-binding protein
MISMAKNLDDLDVPKHPALPEEGRPHVHHYYWGDPRTRFAGWQVVGAGFAGAAYRAAHPIPPRRMRQWLLLTCHAGDGWFSDAAGVRHPWPAGHAVLLAPNQLHAYGRSSADWREWWLLFDGPAAIAAHAAGDLAADARPLPAPPAYAVIAPQVVAAGDAGDGARLVGLLVETLQRRRPLVSAVPDLALSALRGELAAHPERDWNLDVLATRHGMAYDAMRRRFRRVYGLPPQAFLRRERINRSCRLLLEGRSVADAATDAGFHDPFFFSRSFRKIIGVSPRTFIRQSGAGRTGD